VSLVIWLLLIFLAAGFIRYLVKMNRKAKIQQAEVDPEKLRKWSDD